MEQLISLIPQQFKEKSGFSSEPVIDRLQYEQMKANIYNDSIGNLNETDGFNCDLCKNRGSFAKVETAPMYGLPVQVIHPCKCQKARKALARLKRSGLERTVKEYTFQNYKELEPWMTVLKEKALKFCEDDDAWLYIGGQSGCGKTHLCTAAAVKMIKQGCDVILMQWRDESVRLKGMINEPDEYAEAINQLKQVDVLYIDDLFVGSRYDGNGHGMPSEADIKLAFQIINYRYNNNLKTIISTEKKMADLIDINQALAGRIAQKAKPSGCNVSIKEDVSKNYRLRGSEQL